MVSHVINHWGLSIDYEKCINYGKCMDYCTLGVCTNLKKIEE